MKVSGNNWKAVIVATFILTLLAMGCSSLLRHARLRAGMFRHAFFCSCCVHESFSKEWSKLSRFLEQDIGENVLGVDALVTVNGALHRMMGRRTVYDSEYGHLVKSAGGFLWYPTKDGRPAINAIVRELADLRACMAGHVRFLVVLAPDKSMTQPPESHPGVDTHSAVMANSFLSACRSIGFECLDLRDCIDDEKQYFKTDHHWRISTSFIAYQRIASWMQTAGLIGEESEKTRQATNYVVLKKKACFLGSLGRRTGRFYAGLDDFEWLMPTFDTSLRLEGRAESGEVVKRDGTFETVIVRAEHLESLSNDCNRYACYFGGDDAVLTVFNRLCPRGRVLLIKDSFGLPVGAFLSLAVAEMTMTDIRLYRRQGSVADLAKRVQPDVVLLLYNTEMLSNPEMFDFDNSGVERR